MMKQRTRVHHSDDILSMGLNNLKKSDSNHVELHRVRPQDNYIEAQITEGDTLQAVALKFRCSIAELKRINQIHKDNEIFARRTIKIPVTPYSVLTEILPANTANDQLPSTSILNVEQTSNNVVPATISKNEIKGDFAIDCNEVIMNSTVTPSVVPYTDSSELVAEDTLLLPNKEREPVETVIVKQLTSQGADFGIKWYHLLFCLLFLGLLLPIYYAFIYVHEHEHETILEKSPSHLDTSINSNANLH